MNLYTYIQEVRGELKEVKWPSKTQTITYTVIVVLVSTFFALFLGGVDFGLKQALSFLLK